MEAFKILCLGGGGIKGIMHIGALEELEKEVGLLHKHFSKGIYGCSVGSLIATSIAFGITPQQIKKIYNKISNFKKLVDMNDLTKIQNILNNKGIFSMTKFENILIESWRKNIDMHMNGYFLCCKVVLEKMKKQGFGSLINMSSIYGLIAPDFTIYEGTEMTMPAAYSAIKGGLNNLTRYLASYYGKYQVRINTISPGGIYDNQPESFVNNYNNKVPLKRMGTPKDIVSAVFYLLTDESSYVTGHNLVVDGGWSII